MDLAASYSLLQADGVNLNQGSNAVHISTVLPGGGLVRRLHVQADSANGLLAPSVLRVRKSGDGGASWTTVGDLTVGSARGRGVPVYRTFDVSAAQIDPGEKVEVVDQTAGGGTSTGDVSLEVEYDPFNGANKPSDAVEVTS